MQIKHKIYIKCRTNHRNHIFVMKKAYSPAPSFVTYTNQYMRLLSDFAEIVVQTGKRTEKSKPFTLTFLLRNTHTHISFHLNQFASCKYILFSISTPFCGTRAFFPVNVKLKDAHFPAINR